MFEEILNNIKYSILFVYEQLKTRKILDVFIVKKFLGTLGFILGLMMLIYLVIDLSERYGNLKSGGLSTATIFFGYYPVLIVWALHLFLGIVVFISVIYFTARLANNTEIVAIITSGVSFYRFSFPYFITSIGIAILLFFSSHFFLPIANTKKNRYYIESLRPNEKAEYLTSKPITSQISREEYLFVNGYSRETKRGTGFLYQKFNDKGVLLEEIKAQDLFWNDSLKTYVLNQFQQRFLKKNGDDSLVSGPILDKKFKFTPDQLLPEAYVAETMNSFELMDFIDNETEKGSGNINIYLNELYQRTAAPFSIIVLTILALSMSSRKRRGGIGLNLAIGLAIAFIYVFSFEALKIYSESGAMPSWLAVWLPNIIFGILAGILYYKRAQI